MYSLIKVCSHNVSSFFFFCVFPIACLCACSDSLIDILPTLIALPLPAPPTDKATSSTHTRAAALPANIDHAPSILSLLLPSLSMLLASPNTANRLRAVLLSSSYSQPSSSSSSSSSSDPTPTGVDSNSTPFLVYVVRDLILDHFERQLREQSKWIEQQESNANEDDEKMNIIDDDELSRDEIDEIHATMRHQIRTSLHELSEACEFIHQFVGSSSSAAAASSSSRVDSDLLSQSLHTIHRMYGIELDSILALSEKLSSQLFKQCRTQETKDEMKQAWKKIQTFHRIVKRWK